MTAAMPGGAASDRSSPAVSLPELIAKWTNYRDQWPRSFSGEQADPKAVERENTLMSVFIRDLNDLLLVVLPRVEPPQWKCKAQRTADPPQDCNWPLCGCDPYADKVIAALDEIGALKEVARVEPPPAVTVEPKGLVNELAGIQALEHEEAHGGRVRPYAWKQAALQLAEATKEHVTELNKSLGTAQTLLAAWQKRAYEAEAREAARVEPRHEKEHEAAAPDHDHD